MRKINVYTPSLIDMYYKDFRQDTFKFIRAMTLTLEHVGQKFQLKNAEYELVGKVNDKELCCKKIDDNTMWAIEFRTVENIMNPRKRVVYDAERFIKPKMQEEDAEEDDEMQESEDMSIPNADYEAPDTDYEPSDEIENELK